MTAATVRGRRRLLALVALALALLATTLGLDADRASAAYSARVKAKTLIISGNSASDKLVLIASSTTVALDVGANGTADYTFDRDAFTAIDVDAGGDNDEVAVVGSLLGEALTMDGGQGNDVLSGSNADDVLRGGPGADVVDGQQGADAAFLGGDDDRFNWDPGDGNDMVRGERGVDVFDFNGSSIGESIDVSASGGGVRFTRNIGNVVTDLDTVEQIAAHPFAGADVVTVNDLAGTALRTVDVDLNAFAGGGDTLADTVIVNGTGGADTVTPGHVDGRVVIDGLAAQTRVAGDEPALDVVTVRTLAGADTINATVDLGPQPVDADGGEGTDIARYSGTAAGDAIAAFANGLEVTTLANPANPTGRLDTIAVENLNLLGLAGADTITATGNLAPLTALTFDGGADADTLSGGNGADLLLGRGGEDVVDAQQGIDTAFLGTGNDRFQWDPGDGNDTIEGEDGNDTLAFNGSTIGEKFDVSANGQRVRFTRDIANVVTDLDTVEQVALRALGGADTITANDVAGTDLAIVDVDLNAAAGGGDTLADTVLVNGTGAPDTFGLGHADGRVLVDGVGAQTRVAGSEPALDVVSVRTLAGDDMINGTGDLGPQPVDADGGEGTDTARYNGTTGDDAIASFANGLEVTTVANPSNPTGRLDTIAVENLHLLGDVGADTITATGNLAPLTALTFNGGADADTLSGGNGPDQLLGGAGEDIIDGQQGTDTASLGDGDDRFQWDPGDGNDTVEGDIGNDTLAFNGSSIGESIDVSANGQRVRLTRNIGNVVTDLDDVEQIDAHPYAGPDVVTVNDLAGTDLNTFDVNLNALGGGGDTTADTVIARGTEGPDTVMPGHADGRAVIDGLAVQTRVAGDEPALDAVSVHTLAGDDTINATVDLGPQPVDADGGEGIDAAYYNGTAAGDAIVAFANGLEATTLANPASPTGRLDTIAVEYLHLLGHAGADTITATGNLAPLTALTFNGGADADTLSGGNGPDQLLGGAGEDTVDGQQGTDTASLGDGDDRFQWDPGDGNDTVAGDIGNDTLAFNGSSIGESIDVSANGQRVRFTRNIGNVVTDLDTVEQVAFKALGGADTITADDLTGTDLAIVDVDLNLAAGGGDSLADTVIVNGTSNADSVLVTASGTQVLATGLAAETRVAGSEGANDTLRVQTLGGDDDVTVDPGVSSLIAALVDLGTDE